MTLKTPAFNDAKTYGFEWLRGILELALQEGVVGAGDLAVTAAAGGGQRVDIAAGQALVKGDSGVAGLGLTQGLFLAINDAAVANAVTFAASDPTNPRIDQVILRVRDSSDLGTGADDAVFDKVTGAATAGATLDNRNGAGALPADCIRLADVLIPAASAAVVAGNVRSRRQWARGYRAKVQAAGAGITNPAGATWTDYNPSAAGVLQARGEFSGLYPVRAILNIGFQNTSAVITEGQARVVDVGSGAQAALQAIVYGNGLAAAPAPLPSFIPAAGSRLLKAMVYTVVGSQNVNGSGTMELYEDLRPSATNGLT